jgi:hypothetical protein
MLSRVSKNSGERAQPLSRIWIARSKVHFTINFQHVEPVARLNADQDTQRLWNGHSTARRHSSVHFRPRIATTIRR